MSDTTLNRFLATGTTTQRLAFTPSPPTPASGPTPEYLWWDLTLQALYAWDAGSVAWVAVGAGGSGTVTHTGALTSGKAIIGNGTADITVSAATGVAHLSSGALTGSNVDLTSEVTGRLPLANIAQGTALSVLGVTGNATADEASIVAASDGQVVRRSGTAVAFGAVNLASANAVTGALPTTNLGTGAVVQVVNTETGAVSTGTTTIPLDDTIPQNTEGTEFMTLAITPKSATNKLRIDVTAVYACSQLQTFVGVALFQDSTANALAAVIQEVFVADGNVTATFAHFMTSGTTSATTFKVRIGANGASTITFNGRVAGRLYGGVMASSITITEIAV